MSRKPAERLVVGQALEPDQTSESWRVKGAAKVYPKDNSLVEYAAGAMLFQVPCASW